MFKFKGLYKPLLGIMLSCALIVPLVGGVASADDPDPTTSITVIKYAADGTTGIDELRVHSAFGRNQQRGCDQQNCRPAHGIRKG